MNANQKRILAAVDQYAIDNYEDYGLDIWVEAYETSEKLEVIGKTTSVKKAIKLVIEELEPYADQRSEIMSTAF